MLNDALIPTLSFASPFFSLGCLFLVQTFCSGSNSGTQLTGWCLRPIFFLLIFIFIYIFCHYYLFFLLLGFFCFNKMLGLWAYLPSTRKNRNHSALVPPSGGCSAKRRGMILGKTSEQNPSSGPGLTLQPWSEKKLELSLKFVSVGQILPSVLWLVHSRSQKKLGRKRNTDAGKTPSYLQLLNGGLEVTTGMNAVVHSHSHKQSCGGQSYVSWQLRADFLILPVQEPRTCVLF